MEHMDKSCHLPPNQFSSRLLPDLWLTLNTYIPLNSKFNMSTSPQSQDGNGIDLAYLLLFLQMTLKVILSTVIWLPMYLYRCALVTFVKLYKPSFGKILDHVDTSYEEDSYVDNVPFNTLVFTLILDGTIQLQELRDLFTKTVLQAKLSNKKTGQDEMRYPGLKQYLTRYAGFTFWKNDDHFNIAQHIVEQPFNDHFPSKAKLHQEMINKKFARDKSPWELTLVRNYENESNQTLIILRCHHSQGDTLTWVKLIVECLGQKSLRMPNVQYLNASIWEQVRYYALLPFYFIYVQVFAKLTLLKSDQCHWLQSHRQQKNVAKQNISISKKILLRDIKTIAKKNKVTTSAVVMAGVMGGVGKSDKRLAKMAMPVRWMMPKMGHPEILANHHYPRILELPNNISSPLERLQKCNDIILHLKSSNLHQYDESVLFQHATMCSPLRFKLSVPCYSPLILTNIATDGEGFQVGSASCKDFTMTSGGTRSIICAVSYKDTMEVTTTMIDSIMNEQQTDELTELIEKEFEILRTSTT